MSEAEKGRLCSICEVSLEKKVGLRIVSYKAVYFVWNVTEIQTVEIKNPIKVLIQIIKMILSQPKAAEPHK